MSQLGRQGNMARGAHKARAIAISAQTRDRQTAAQVLLASGILLTTLLALLLMRP